MQVNPNTYESQSAELERFVVVSPEGYQLDRSDHKIILTYQRALNEIVDFAYAQNKTGELINHTYFPKEFNLQKTARDPFSRIKPVGKVKGVAFDSKTGEIFLFVKNRNDTLYSMLSWSLADPRWLRIVFVLGSYYRDVKTIYCDNRSFVRLTYRPDRVVNQSLCTFQFQNSSLQQVNFVYARRTHHRLPPGSNEAPTYFNGPDYLRQKYLMLISKTGEERYFKVEPDCVPLRDDLEGDCSISSPSRTPTPGCYFLNPDDISQAIVLGPSAHSMVKSANRLSAKA